ncbi:MAG: amidohydrolase family protein [Candidatus Xenobiia bacterium LiM19]
MKKNAKSPRRVNDTDGEPLTRRSALKKIGAVMAGSMIGAGMIGSPAEARESFSTGGSGTANKGRNLVIDIHAHLAPPGTYDNITYMHDVDLLKKQQDEAGVDITVISDPMFGFPWDKGESRCLDLIKKFHDFAGALVARNKGRFVAFASANPFGGDGYLKEVERAVNDGGMKGICVNSSVNGEYLDSKRAYPLYELAIQLDVPIFEHPPESTMGAEYMHEYRLSEMVGRPCDTTLSIARLILFGVLERYPELKLICAHMGGAMMMLPGRLDFGYTLRGDTKAFGPWEPDLLTMAPSEYIKKLYVDSMGFHAPGVLCAVSTIGADHVLLGSDHPPVPISLKKSVDLIREIPLPENDKKKILGRNAACLLKI